MLFQKSARVQARDLEDSQALDRSQWYVENDAVVVLGCGEK